MTSRIATPIDRAAARDVSRAVGTAVVDHEDVGVGQCAPRLEQNVADGRGFVIGGNDDQDAFDHAPSMCRAV